LEHDGVGAGGGAVAVRGAEHGTAEGDGVDAEHAGAVDQCSDDIPGAWWQAVFEDGDVTREQADGAHGVVGDAEGEGTGVGAEADGLEGDAFAGAGAIG
jgi:hypothetical protein